MIKNFSVLLSTAAGAALALAAGPAMANPPPPPIFTWTGFYLGVNGGFGGGVATTTLNTLAPPLAYGDTYAESNSLSHRMSGFLVGGQFGYNYQLPNRVVLGVETDFQWSGIRGTDNDANITQYCFGCGADISPSQSNITQNWFGSTRLRLGYAVSDRLLPYITGGLAYSDFAANHWGVGYSVGPGWQGVYSLTGGGATSTQLGWTLGAGLEYALNNSLSVKTEYLYSQYSGVTAPYLNAGDYTPPVNVGTFSTGTIGIHSLRAGLNYRLGAAPGGFDGAFAEAFGPSAGFAWSGFYVGVNGGCGGGVVTPNLPALHMEVVNGANTYPETDADTFRAAGFHFGGQAGYNHQFANNVVLGLETDFQWSGVTASNHSDMNGLDNYMGPFNSFSRMNVDQNWFGTTRARLGYPVLGALPYITGGVAYSEFFIRNSSGFATLLIGDNGAQGGAATATKAGWTLGAGFEFPVCEHVTFKTEYLYSEFGGVSTPYAYNEVWSPNFYGALGSMQSGTLGVHMVRAGFNWQLR